MLDVIFGKLQTWWRPVIIGAVAITLMLPLPAFALDWLDNWNVSQRQTFFAPPANVTSSDTANGGNLTVDMQALALPFFPFSSSVTATRDFEASGSQALDLVESFQSFLHATNLSVTVKLTPLSFGHSTSFPAVNDANRGGPISFVDYYNESQRNINASGNYRITISIKYNKNRFSGRGLYSDVSPFSFTFTGI